MAPVIILGRVLTISYSNCREMVVQHEPVLVNLDLVPLLKAECLRVPGLHSPGQESVHFFGRAQVKLVLLFDHD